MTTWRQLSWRSASSGQRLRHIYIGFLLPGHTVSNSPDRWFPLTRIFKKYAEILSKEWCWLTGDELTDMVEDENFQWIWGVLSAFPKHIKKETILKYKLPKARENSKIWQNPISMQHPLSVMEIIAWDSSMTVVISKCDDVINQLKSDKPWAEDLEQYNNSIGKKDGI